MRFFLISILIILSTFCFAGGKYIVDENYESTNCEFYVDNFYLESKAHYGVPNVRMVTSFKVNKQWGKLKRVGQWIRFVEKRNHRKSEQYVFGDYDRSIEFLVKRTRDMDREILEFAYFIDVLRPEGEIVRLWQSNGGKNFRLKEVMGGRSHETSIPYGKREYADQNVGLFNQKRSCL